VGIVSGISETTRRRLPFLFCILGFAPLMWWHVGQLLERSHYQFVVFLPIALYLLLFSLPAETGATAPKRWESLLGLGILLMSGAALAVATIYWSPWIAAVGLLVSLLGILFLWGGTESVTRWLPIWTFCLIIIPLPFGIDEDVVLRLRNITTQWSSRVLDHLGLMHQVYANVIELPGKSLFIADACSGIHSLFVLMAVGLFVSAWNRRGLLHLICLLVSTFAWVLVENVARIVIVSFAWTLGYDLSVGSPHFALGIVLFCLSGLLILSTDQFLLFLLPEGLLSRLSLIPSFASSPTQGGIARSESLANTEWPKPIVTLFFAGVFPVLGILQMIRMPDNAPEILSSFSSELELPELGATALQNEIAGFTQSNYKILKRVKGDPFGQESQQWTYRKGPVTASIYLDYPHAETHDLCLCYSQIGWGVDSRKVLPAGSPLTIDGQQVALRESVASARLSREFYGDAVILFSQFDMAGQHFASVQPATRATVESRLTGRFADPSPPSTKAAVDAPKPPFVQIQLFATGLAPEQEDQQRAELLMLYEQAREDLRTLVLEKTSPSSDKPLSGS
jgi:exosortase